MPQKYIILQYYFPKNIVLFYCLNILCSFKVFSCLTVVLLSKIYQFYLITWFNPVNNKIIIRPKLMGKIKLEKKQQL